VSRRANAPPAVELELMPVVLLIAAVLLSFVLVLPLVVAWLPVTLHGALLFLERG